MREQTKIARKMMKNGNLMMHTASLALAVEAIEAILVEKGIFEKDQLMGRVEELRNKYYAAGEFIPAAED